MFTTEIAEPGFYKMPKSFSIDEKLFVTSYSKRKHRYLTNVNKSLIEIENLSLVQDSSLDVETLSDLAINDENTIVISVRDGLWGYFHLIYNVLGEIEVIQKFVPNSKIKLLFFCNDQNFKEFLKKIESLGILSAYNIKSSDIINVYDFKSISIKKFIFMHTEHNFLSQQIADIEFFFKTSWQDLASWSQIVSTGMKTRFGQKENIAKNKKIFISNLNTNEWNRKISNALKQKINGVAVDPEILPWVENIPEKEYKEYIDRPMSREEEQKLEKKFEEIGYGIIDTSNFKSIFDAAKIFGSASKIVSLTGGGLINTCFASEDAKVLILNNSDLYRFPHKEVVQSFGVNCNEAPQKRPWSAKTYNADEIFESVNNLCPDFLKVFGV